MRLDGFRITNYMQEYGSYDLERVGADIELMCHPIWDMGKIVDSVTGTIIERKIGNLVNYSDL